MDKDRNTTLGIPTGYQRLEVLPGNVHTAMGRAQRMIKVGGRGSRRSQVVPKIRRCRVEMLLTMATIGQVESERPGAEWVESKFWCRLVKNIAGERRIAFPRRRVGAEDDTLHVAFNVGVRKRRCRILVQEQLCLKRIPVPTRLIENDVSMLASGSEFRPNVVPFATQKSASRNLGVRPTATDVGFGSVQDVTTRLSRMRRMLTRRAYGMAGTGEDSIGRYDGLIVHIDDELAVPDLGLQRTIRLKHAAGCFARVDLDSHVAWRAGVSLWSRANWYGHLRSLVMNGEHVSLG